MTFCGSGYGFVSTHVCVATAFLAACPPCWADGGAAFAARPPLSDACRAWDAHISDLIDQHRKSNELDDAAFGEVVRRFYDAQAACAAGRFGEGLTAYEAIPVGRVATRPLR